LITRGACHFFVIDFVAIKQAALRRALPLLKEWLPNGHLEGDEYVACNPTRADNNPGSFKVNLKTGAWSDFATNDKGGDLISLFAYLRNMSQGNAARELAGRLGLNGDGRQILTLEELADAKGLPVQFLKKYGLVQLEDGILIQFFNPDGILASRHQKRIRLVDESYVNKNGKERKLRRFYWTGEKGSGGIIPYGLETLVPARSKRLFVVEGPTDRLTGLYHQLDVLALPGASTAKLIHLEHVLPFDEIVAVLEPDKGGETLRKHLPEHLAALNYPGKLRALKMPQEFKDLNGLHLKTLGDPGGFEAELEELLKLAEPLTIESKCSEDTQNGKADCLPGIDCTSIDLPTLTPLAWNAVKAANDANPVLFEHDRRLVRVGKHRHDNGPIIEPIDVEILRYHAARAAWWHRIRQTRSGPVAVSIAPPKTVLEDMLAEPDKPLPPLIQLSEVPMFDLSGKLHDQPGYIPELAVFYVPAPDLKLAKVSVRPTDEELRTAKLLIHEPFKDFKFASNADRATPIALFLQPFMRHLIRGSTPLFAFDAPVQGSGKGLAARSALLPTIRTFGSFAYTPDHDEMRKALTSVLSEGRPVVMIDNATGLIDNPVLAKVLTDGYHSDRLLSLNRTVNLRVTCTFAITGNNLSFGGDLPRRVVPCRIDTGLERPWERKPEDFTHPRLLIWVEEHRSDLIWAGLTALAAWFAKGAPRSEKTLGSYEECIAITGGVLEFLGVPDFLANLGDFYTDTDAETRQWIEFTGYWDEAFKEHSEPPTSKELLPHALKAGLPIRGKDDDAKVMSLGHQLRRMRGRRFGKFVIEQVPGRHSQWRLKFTESD